MPLPVLVVLGATGASLAVARLLDKLANESSDPGKLPASWAPGTAPAGPWKADRERNATGEDTYVDCLPGGKRGDDANAVFARWLNHEKGVPLPGRIVDMSRSEVAKWASSWAIQVGLRSATAAGIAAEWDALALGCMGREAFDQFKAAPGKAGKWIKDRVGSGSGGVSAGNDNTGGSVSTEGGEVHVAGVTVASW